MVSLNFKREYFWFAAPTSIVWFKKNIFSPEILVTGVRVRIIVVPAALSTSSKPCTSTPVISGIDTHVLGVALLRASKAKIALCSFRFALIVEPCPCAAISSCGFDSMRKALLLAILVDGGVGLSA